MATIFADNSLRGAGPKLRDRAVSVVIGAGSSAVRHKLEQLARSAGMQVMPESSKHDVVLYGIDAHFTLPESTEALTVLTRQSAICIVCVKDADSIQPISRLLQAGISAILPIEIELAQFRSALEAVRSGLQVVHPSFIQQKRRSITAENAAEELTDREQQVLSMMADGLGNKEIAVRLGISTHTVKFHISSILGKLGAGSRTEAVSIGMRTGRVLI
ncbi:MAG TPA: response regulator transcription factor [Terriglobales bacterium]|nr:response regulator transcription factor [Terriglobales bacterium]